MRFQRLQVRSEKLTYSTGPPPYSGEKIYGSILLEDVTKAIAINERSLPLRLVGAHGRADFLPKSARIRIIEGVFHFVGIVEEKSFWDATGFLEHNSTVQIDFGEPGGPTWSALGTMELLKAGEPAHPGLERALKE